MTKTSKIIVVCVAVAVAFVLGSEIFKIVRFRRFCESTDAMKTHIDTVRSFSTQTRRGDILDCKGHVLATIGTVYGVYLDAGVPSDILWTEVLPELSTGLAEMLGDRTPEEYCRYLMDGRTKGNRFLKICKDINRGTLDSLKSLPLFNLSPNAGGVIVETMQKRVYPYGPLARRTIGIVRNNIPELGNNHIGIEGSFNETLSGKDGYEVIKDRHVRLPFGKVKHIRKTIGEVKPENGENVTVTLDIELQAVADSLLRAGIGGNENIKGACFVLVSTNDGAIRTMVNLTKDEKGEFRENYNVAIGYGYEPGGIIAPATALAAAKCNPAITLSGLDFTPKDALRDIAGKCSPSVYCDALKTMLQGEHAFSHLELNGLASLQMITPDDNNWSASTLGSIANGYSIMAPAFQWLGLYTAIARGGEGIDQRLVAPISGADYDRILYTLCSKEQADALTESLKAASAVRMSGAAYEMAGITGTSFIAMPRVGYTDEYGRHAMQSSYAGFFPADNPAFSIICMVYTGPMSNTSAISAIPSQVVKAFVGCSIVTERVGETFE